MTAGSPRSTVRDHLARALGIAVILACGVGAASLLTAPGTEATPQPAVVTTHQALHFEPNPLVLRAISRSIRLSQAEALAGPSPTLAEPSAEDDDAGSAETEALAKVDEHLREVYWTVPERSTTDLLAANWGLGSTFFTLNPALEPGEKVDAGARIKVYAADPTKPTRSVGHPNRGRLQNGLPLPEGSSWRLRPNRRRTFGTHKTISTLVDAFQAYGERYPDAPPVRVGEIAKRRGGRAKPHASHRTGRDVDLGYIGVAEDDGEVRWQRMGESTLDAEKSWFLIHELIKSGNVDTIFISSRLQKFLYRAAKAQGLPEEEVRRIFQHPRHPDSPSAIIKHWRGHVNHMHVRFRCEDWNSRCRGERRSSESDANAELELESQSTPLASAMTSSAG